PHANEKLEAYFHANGPMPADGSVVDVSLQLADWVNKLLGRLKRGVALVIDYAASPPRDTLLTYYRHTMGSDPLVRLGQQDITAHVALQMAMRLAVAEGLRTEATTQRGMLMK